MLRKNCEIEFLKILISYLNALSGKGLEDTIKEEISNGLENEEWHFIGSKDGDLTYD